MSVASCRVMIEMPDSQVLNYGCKERNGLICVCVHTRMHACVVMVAMAVVVVMMVVVVVVAITEQKRELVRYLPKRCSA